MQRFMRKARAVIPAGLIGLLSGIALVSTTATPVSAHDPIILTDRQTTPAAGPLLVDGTISFALYGTIEAPGETRGFRVRFKAGDTFTLSALIPDLAPERRLARRDLPEVTVITPTGDEIPIERGKVTSFAEPFTGTNYRRYVDWSMSAVAGDYGVVVTGEAPARFTVSVGVQERFGTDVQDVPNRDAGVGGVMKWYETPPPSVTTTTTAARSTSSSAPSATTGSESAGTATDDSGEGTNAVVPALAIGAAVVAVAGALVWRRRRGASPS